MKHLDIIQVNLISLFDRLDKLSQTQSVWLNTHFSEENIPVEENDQICKGYVWLRIDKQLKKFTSTKRNAGSNQWEFSICLSQGKIFPLNFPLNFLACWDIAHSLSLEFLSIWASFLCYLLVSPFHIFQTFLLMPCHPVTTQYLP